ncbi:hypothetical protein BUALT_Bualt14G0001600 [Buddleja alternifolia]|uniref:poly(ADP-ribose) glycohydrolase n=1 Tax=Buddleja alternifolia TaxID=168488 RepID=A0AAV6WF28_9LAMI|nr:hypothetical protein BUALT_Bualt14G0001600 [Buddleja alternifolia]
MECRDDLGSILPFLPLILRSSDVFWPPAVVEALKSLSKGPLHSNVNSGHLFALAIADLRNSLGFSSLYPSVSLGFSLFFDDLMSSDEADKWFGEVVPRLADLLLRLPALLETHYQNAGIFNGMVTGLRLLDSQQSGIVFLSQELIAALLVCALFCLFPSTNRGAKHLPPINFDNLFACLYEWDDTSQEDKIKCIVHYFEKVCSDMPMGNVSFERKVLPLENSPSNIFYPEADFWRKSHVSLCQLEVRTTGLIEDQSTEALEVDFANKYIGGGALSRGCVQEEIRFMINPELIISMLFLPSMADNEAIEIVGTERFSNYTGYASSFCFSGDYMDPKNIDKMGRRKTRIIAIDALCRPGNRQYKLEYLLRETNKAFCGFFYQTKVEQYQTLFKENRFLRAEPMNNISSEEYPDDYGEIGIVTGNWGCGAFGGDPEVKAVIQWLAASQALRPFILYHTFNLEVLQKLERVVQWILSHKWTVGELWNILVDYSTRRLKGETNVGLFNWLIPSLYNDDDNDPMVLDASRIT